MSGEWIVDSGKKERGKAEGGRGLSPLSRPLPPVCDSSAFRLPPSPFCARSGISLLEVLVSIAVLLFGLLAVAMLVPVAGLRIIQTNQADYSAACGQAGLRDVKVRRMLEPRNWLSWDASVPAFVDTAVSVPPLAIRFRNSYAIDPLGYGEDDLQDSVIEPRMARFPYYGGGGGNRTMMRVTLDIDPPNDTAMPYELADRIFRWRDDLSIPIPTDPGDRPQATMIMDAANNALFPEIQGKYSWLVTVTPNVTTPESGLLHHIDKHRSYLVSVAVFFNRDFSVPNSPLNPDVPGERMAIAQILGGGFGGGDVRLLVLQNEFDANGDGLADPSEDLNANGDLDTLAAEYLDVQRGHWLMLCGTDTTTSPTRDAFRWYRVVAKSEIYEGTEDIDDDKNLDVDEDTNGNGILDPGEDLDGDLNLDVDEDLNGNGSIDLLWVRDVTLAGPDWTFGNPAQAALFTRVIGVYSKTIELDDRGSLWAN